MINLLKSATDRTKIIGICFVLIAMVWIVFGQTLSFNFINCDDPQYVTENPLVKGGMTWSGIAHVLTHSDYSFYHPLTTLSHMLDYQIYGLNPAGFHFTNVLLHTVSVLLLFLVLRSMTGSLWRSALVAAVYAIHPLRAESVAWVTERKDTLSGLFFMLMLGAYTRYARGREQRAEGREQRAAVFRPLSSGSYWLVFLFMAAGMLSKATLVTAPFVLLLLDFWPLRRFGAWGMGQGAAVFAKGFAEPREGGENCRTGLSSENMKDCRTGFPYPGARAKEGHAPSFGQARPTIFGSARPMDSRVQPSKPHQPSTNNYQLLLEKIPFLILSAVVCGVTAITSKESIVSQESIPFISRVFNAADSYVIYIRQSVFPAKLAAFYPHPVENFSLWKIGGALLFLSLVTFAALAGWRKRPYLLTGWFWYLGMLIPVIGILQAGCQAHADRYTYLAQIGLVILLVWALSDLCARWKVRRAFVFSAAMAVLVALCATAYIQTTHWRDSFRIWSHALACTERNSAAHIGLGKALLAEGKTEQAIPHFEKALEINPDNAPEHYNLGNLFFGQENFIAAIRQYEQTLQLCPDYTEAKNNLAWLLATCSDAALRDGQRAVELMESVPAVQTNPSMLDTLAAAYAEAGRYPEAAATARQALELMKAQKNEAGAGPLRARLARYEDGLPYHEEAHPKGDVPP